MDWPGLTSKCGQAVFFGWAHWCNKHSMFLRLELCCSHISGLHGVCRMTLPGLLISLEEAVVVRSLFSALVHTTQHAASMRTKQKACSTSSSGSIHLLWFPHFQFARDAILVLAGIELIFFLVVGGVLCFGFGLKIMLMITHWLF